MEANRFHKHRMLAKTAKAQQTRRWLTQNNIVGVSYGRKIVHNKITDEPSIVVYVMKKMSKGILPPSQLLPRKIYIGGDYINVDVVETGPIYPLAFTARERPAPSGISIGHPSVTAGTLGCLVQDLSDGSTCILSNNHVMANENNATIGDSIIQPGTADGGVTPGDVIARLKNFQMINPTGNTIDAAIAEVGNVADVIDQMKNNLMDVPTPSHPAVGLLFAGSSSRTYMNPIDDVLNTLNIEFLNGPGATVAPDIGMNVEKVGRTTEYTTSSILEIDATITVGFQQIGNIVFDNQIVTSCMSLGGDSGSVVCRGGEGQEANDLDCGCGSSQAAQTVLKRDIRADIAAEKIFREKHLVHTRTGRYLLDTFFDNEDYIIERSKKAQTNREDTAYAQHLYDKYADKFRCIALNPDSKDKATKEHFKEAEQALGRLKPYLNKSEINAAEQLFKVAHQFEGKTAREALKMLDDTKIYNQVVKIVSKVDSLKKRDC